jgi:glycosyl transferase family 25
MQYISKIFYINLDKRTDRRQEIETELNRMGLEAERYAAIHTPHSGIVGCGYSHLNVLKKARDLNLENVLILEDDFMFLVDRETFDKEINQFFESELGKDFDVLMISYIVQKSRDVEGYTNVKKVIDGQTASGYIVNKRYYNTIIDLYDWAIPLLEQTNEHWNYANDHVWKRLQPVDDWYFTTLRIGRQRCGYSDNKMCYMESIDG